MSKLTPRRILIVAGVALLLLIVGWYQEVLSPTQRHNAALQAETGHSSQSIIGLQSQLRSLEAAVHQLPHTQAQEAAVEQLLPSSLSLPEAITQIQATASTAGMVWTGEQTKTTATTTSKKPSTGLQTEQITMSLTGTYPQVVQFLTAFNTMPRLAQVNYLSLSDNSATPTAGQQQLSLSVTATLYYDNAPVPTVPHSIVTASTH